MAIEFNTLVCYIKNMSTVASLLPQDEQAIITHYCVCFRCQFEKPQAKKKKTENVVNIYWENSQSLLFFRKLYNLLYTIFE